MRAGSASARLLLLSCCCLFATSALRAQQATEEWSARYDGPDGISFTAVSIAADNAGNSYVTGSSSRDAAGITKLVTIKYSPAGKPLWTRAYSGATASAIVVDNAGGVYVTGTFTVNTSDTDYLTVRYDAATGTQSWARTYDALYGDPTVGRDSPIAIAVDNAGGVYVTGTSSRARASAFSTVRYDAATGVQSWARTDGGSFSSARAIAVDNAGGVYITGTGRDNPTTTLSRFYVTVRYDAVTGSLSWLTTYTNPIASTYNFSDASAIAVDNSGGVYVTGTSRNDYATVRYAAATGVQSWVSTYNGPANGSDDARAIAADNTGGVYVTGASFGTADKDYATVRYAAATGAQSWASTYNGPANGPDEARAIAADNAGGVYVTGTSSGTANSDYATVRYRSADGSLVWMTGAGQQNAAAALAVDNSGNVFVTGTSSGATMSSFLTIKYSQTAPANAFTFYRAINLNGPALTLDGNAWAGRTAPNYATNGIAFQNQRVPLTPATDAARAGMIRAAVYRPGSLHVTLAAVPVGTYQVYVYVWEDNNAEVFDLSVNGQVVRRSYNSGPAGSWERLGPYLVALASPGTVRVSSSGGAANFSGIELWQEQANDARPAAATAPKAALSAQARTLAAAPIQTYPNPSADGRFHLVLPEDLQGEVTYTLVSALGKQLGTGTLRVPIGGTADLDFSRQLTEPGMCYLQLKGAHAQTNLKLLRN